MGMYRHGFPHGFYGSKEKTDITSAVGFRNPNLEFSEAEKLWIVEAMPLDFRHAWACLPVQNLFQPYLKNCYKYHRQKNLKIGGVI